MEIRTIREKGLTFYQLWGNDIRLDGYCFDTYHQAAEHLIGAGYFHKRDNHYTEGF